MSGPESEAKQTQALPNGCHDRSETEQTDMTRDPPVPIPLDGTGALPRPSIGDRNGSPAEREQGG